MDLINGLRAFVATAQSGSFTRAADQLGISNRLTSKYVGELEDRLGVRLFQRTTRKVGLTPAGEELFLRAPALLEELDGVLSTVAEGSTGFGGVIRVSAPVTFGEIYVAGMLGRFGEANPDLTIDLRLTDAYVDLAAEGIDVAFRVGSSETLSLKTRKLSVFYGVPVASEAYLRAHGTPEHPEDLIDHRCIVDTNRKVPRRWSFRLNKEEKVVTVNGRFHVNSAHAAAQLARAGKGIAYVPDFAVNSALRSGDLVSLLEEYGTEENTLNAVYLEGRTLPRKVRALIDFALEDIRRTKARDMGL